MFDNDFRANNGKAHAKNIITILCNYDMAMTKTLRLLHNLLEPHPPFQVVVPATPRSPSIVVTKEGESSATLWMTEFRVPKLTEKQIIRSPQMTRLQTRESSRIRSPTQLPIRSLIGSPMRAQAVTVAKLIRQEEVRMTSLEARQLVRGVAIHLSHTEVIPSQSSKRMVMVETTRTYISASVPVVDIVVSPRRKRSPVAEVGSEWGVVSSSLGRH